MLGITNWEVSWYEIVCTSSCAKNMDCGFLEGVAAPRVNTSRLWWARPDPNKPIHKRRAVMSDRTTVLTAAIVGIGGTMVLDLYVRFVARVFSIPGTDQPFEALVVT